MKNIFTYGIFLLFLIGIGNNVKATTIQAIYPLVDNNWGNANNWNPAQVPTYLDDVTIPSGDSISLSALSAYASCQSLNLSGKLLVKSNGLYVNGNITVNNGGVFNLDKAVYCKNINNNGTLYAPGRQNSASSCYVYLGYGYNGTSATPSTDSCTIVNNSMFGWIRGLAMGTTTTSNGCGINLFYSNVAKAVNITTSNGVTSGYTFAIISMCPAGTGTPAQNLNVYINESVAFAGTYTTYPGFSLHNNDAFSYPRTCTIAAGDTVFVAGQFPYKASAPSATQTSSTYNIYGCLDLGTYNRSKNELDIYTSPTSPYVAVNVKSGGTLVLGKAINMVQTVASPTQTASINISPNSTVKFGYTASSPSFTSTLASFPSTFYNLSIATGTYNVTLPSATTVNGTLTLSSGTLVNSSPNYVTLGVGANIVMGGGALSIGPNFGSSVNLTYGAPITNQIATTTLITSPNAATTYSSQSVTLSASNSNITVGATVSGTGIPAGTTVTAINGTALTLSQNATLTGSYTLTFGVASPNMTLSVANANIKVGATVTGNGIPAGTTVSAISGTALTLSQSPLNAGYYTLTFSFISPQTTGNEIPTANVISNMTINNVGGVTLNSATTINGTLNISSGTLNLGSYSHTAGALVIGTTGEINGIYGGTGSTATGVIINTTGFSPATGALTVNNDSENLTWTGTTSTDWNTATNWNPAIVPTVWTNLVTIPTASNNPIISTNTTVNSISISLGGLLTVNDGNQLTVNTSFSNSGTLNLLSTSTNGTATILTPSTLGGTGGSYNVNQYLPSGRNWYVSSPVATAATSIVSTGNALYSFDEPSTSWSSNPTSDANFVVTKGYVANIGLTSSTNYTFTGGALNNGTIISPSLTSKGSTEAGFNLVGNPYPSYINWESVYTASTNMEPSIWYRTQNGSNAYVFDTYNATNHTGTNNNGTAVTQYLAPMQAVWARVNSGQKGTLVFDNTMRSHQDQTVTTNRLKSKAASIVSTTQQELDLKVSNGVNSDEAIVVFNPNASDGFDAFDSEKMSNNNPAVPEIFTTVAGQDLVIDGLNSIATNPVLPLGFTTGASNTFTIKATKVSNFDATTRIILQDNLLNTQQDLTDGTAYTFTSDVASTTSRFSVIFKSTAVTTGVQTASGDLSVLIYKNANQQITVNCTGSISDNANVSVYNAVGQKLDSKQITGTTTVIGRTFASGVYVVTVNNGGKSTTKKVILN